MVAKEAKVKIMNASNVNSNSIDLLVAQHTAVRSICKKRKDQCMEVVGMLIEDVPAKKRKESLEAFGLELDETAMPPQIASRKR